MEDGNLRLYNFLFVSIKMLITLMKLFLEINRSLYVLHPERILIDKHFFYLKKYCDMFSTLKANQNSLLFIFTKPEFLQLYCIRKNGQSLKKTILVRLRIEM